ncbi:MAG: prepilin-type N-terminal cleavage/methylation domain-containing protein [Armatimonadota bacterium]
MGATKRTAQHRSSVTHGGSTRGGFARGGFTLTELLVVIGIGVLLMGLLIPTGRALRAGNRALSCKSQLQQIGTALKAYYYDEGGAPYFYIEEGQALTDPPTGAGLMALYDAGYLSRRESLHCPRDVYTRSGDEAYYDSYQRYDTDVAGVTELDHYSYLSTRGVTDNAGAYYHWQLMPATDATAPPTPAPTRNWRPDDQAIITWCPFHVPEIEVADEGAYQVLFWDGSVQRFPQSTLTAPTVVDAAWKIGHDGDGAE